MYMDIWHRLGRIFRLSNLGTFIFFLLNIGLIFALVCPYGVAFEAAVPLVVCYIATVLIGLSPIGEWTLATLAGAREIKRKDVKIRLIPLLEVVLDQARVKNPSMVNSIRLKIIDDQAPNAFAIGRRTICVTAGLLKLSDEEIMAVFAHEMGHIVYHHSTIQLLIGGGNVFISGCLLILKLICWIITAFCGLIAGIAARSFFTGILATLAMSISAGMIWLWTRFCMLFLMWSMRQNEFVADEYAYSLGYGDTLASILDRHICSSPGTGLLKALYSTHPHRDDRIARLQELGAAYLQF